jgi:hypothetical protein
MRFESSPVTSTNCPTSHLVDHVCDNLALIHSALSRKVCDVYGVAHGDRSTTHDRLLQMPFGGGI